MDCELMHSFHQLVLTEVVGHQKRCHWLAHELEMSEQAEQAPFARSGTTVSTAEQTFAQVVMGIQGQSRAVLDELVMVTGWSLWV